MASRYSSFAELARHFETVAARLPVAEKAMLFVIGGVVQKRAQEKHGHYQPGWAKLAATTLEGWNGYPGKIELGFAPPDNPLLRTGHQRNSISFSVEPRAVTVGDKDPKAIFSELGTSKEPARPVVGPAMIESMPENLKIISEGIAETFSRAP